MTKPVRETGRNRGQHEHSSPSNAIQLSNHHLTTVLEPRAVTSEQAELRGYYSIATEAELTALGFSTAQARDTGGKGLVIPLHNSERVWGYQFRPDRPRIQARKNGEARAIKYELPAGETVQIDIAPGSKPLEDMEAEIWITEGSLKADALICGGADIALGLAGVWGYRHPAVMAFIDRMKWKGRRVVVALDSDTGTNRQVAQAAWRIGQHIVARGGSAMWLELPAAKDGSKQGVDDLLAAGTTLSDIREMVHPHPQLFSYKRRTGSEGELLPLIVANAPVPFDERVRAAANALAANNNPERLFSRGGSPVIIKGNEHDRVQTELVPEHFGRVLLSEAADWVVIGEKKGEPFVRATDPPQGVAKAVLQLPDPGFPRLNNLSFGPVLRPDFSIASKPGYDKATEIFIVGSSAVALNVPDNPTQTDAQSAGTALLDLFADFGLDDASRANVLSMALTSVIRPAVNGLVPAFAINKSTPGEGGTLLTDVAAIIATGKELPRKSFINNENQMRQQITSTLQDGDPLGGFDNADGQIKSVSLEVMLTGHLWQERQFHAQSNLVLPNRVTLILNGIGLEPTGGLVRRVVPIVLRSGLENPERRAAADFTHPNLTQYVKDNRGDYLSTIFTMAKAWKAAGSPKSTGLPPFASYEEWRNIVGGILQFAGIKSFLSNMYEWRESTDEDAAITRAFFRAWWDGTRDTKLTTAEVVERIDSDPVGTKWDFKLNDLTPLLGEGRGDPIKRLPFLLKRLAGSVKAGLVLSFTENSKGMKLWSLSPVNAETSDTENGLSASSAVQNGAFSETSETFTTNRVNEKTNKKSHVEGSAELSGVSAFGADSSSNSRRKSAETSDASFVEQPEPTVAAFADLHDEEAELEAEMARQAAAAEKGAD